MNFEQYWTGLTAEQKAKLATRANTSMSYLSQVAHGHRRAGAAVIERLMAADKAISFDMMRRTA